MSIIVESGIVEATNFPLALVCLELVKECMNIYDPMNRYIREFNGEVLLPINRGKIISSLKIPIKEVYYEFSISKSLCTFSKKR